MTKISLVHVDTLSCEPILRKTPNGELIIVSQCGDTKEPGQLNRVYAFHSKDEGEMWTKTTSVYKEDGNAVYSTEVSIIGDSIYVFLTLHNGYFLNFKNVVVRSDDSGYTWEEEELFKPLPGFVFYRGMITLKDGTLLIPYQQYLVTKEEDERLQKENKYIWHANIDKVINGVMISKDKKSFYLGGTTEMPLYINDKRVWQWPEPTLAQLSNGDIVMLLRFNHMDRLYESRSKDLGESFSKIKRTNIKNPGNKPKLIQISDTEIGLLNTFKAGKTYKERCPLSLCISNDDMKTWGYKKALVTYPGWLSYPDGIFDKGKILFAFDFNRHDIYFVSHQIKRR